MVEGGDEEHALTPWATRVFMHGATSVMHHCRRSSGVPVPGPGGPGGGPTLPPPAAGQRRLTVAGTLNFGLDLG